MNFGDILNDWEKQEKNKTKNSIMENVLKYYPPDGSAYREKLAADTDNDSKRQARRQLREMPHQREIDLHGFKAREAVEKLACFISACKKENLKKILIIHGKGNHSSSGPVLQKIILQYIQQCPLAGEYGFASRALGGRGALWVILR